MVELEQSTAIEMINTVGKEAWFVYSGMRFLAVDSIVNLTQEQIAGLLGVSKSVFIRHLKKLTSYKVGDETLVRVIRTADGNVYQVALIKVKAGTSIVPTPKTSKTSPTNELFDYWLTSYQHAYGDPYQVANFAKEKSHCRTLANRYGGDVTLVKAIMDVVIRLYPSRWKTAQYTRPTLGALVSWLALQAEPLAKANLEVIADPEIVITTDDGKDIFDVYDKKWGLS